MPYAAPQPAPPPAWAAPESGRLTQGAPADLDLFSLNDLNFSGALDPIPAIITAGASRADRVMVAGQWVVEDGTIPGLDIQALIQQHTAAARALHAG